MCAQSKSVGLHFYIDQKISPVHQDLTNLERHFQVRGSLYTKLGLPSKFITDNFEMLTNSLEKKQNNFEILKCCNGSLEEKLKQLEEKSRTSTKISNFLTNHFSTIYFFLTLTLSLTRRA